MTRRRRSAAIVALCLTMLMSACDDASRSPTSPTPTPAATVPTPTPAVTGMLSGLVFEVTPAGKAPVEGVKILCDTCGAGHIELVTDVNGAYSFGQVANGRTPLWFSKPGYNLAQPDYTGEGGGGMNATVNGDTRFDIELVRQ